MTLRELYEEAKRAGREVRDVGVKAARNLRDVAEQTPRNFRGVEDARRSLTERSGGGSGGGSLLPNRLQMESNFNDAVMRLKGAWRSRYTGPRK